MMGTIELKVIEYGSEEYWNMVKLRHKVLREPLGLEATAEELKEDYNNVLCACMMGDDVLGCCVLQAIDDEVVQLRQMAVTPTTHLAGIGSGILHFAEDLAKEKGYSKMKLHARRTAEGFYDKHNYVAVGEEFEKVGIPHIEMCKKIE